MFILDSTLEDYCTTHTQAEPDLLHQLYRETYQKVLQPRMLSGHAQGRMLSLLSKLHKPKTILEIGTYTGYSAICLAEGLAENGTLHTLDINEELAPFYNKYFEKAGIANKVNAVIGNALDIIPTIEGEFDLVFMDADKHNYINYFNLVADRMPSGGLLLIDNVLWSGKVLEPAKEKDIDTQALQKLNKLITEDIRFENVLVPLRDGLMMARRV
jgi:caffeoyl-CoA O-methyltransferase